MRPAGHLMAQTKTRSFERLRFAVLRLRVEVAKLTMPGQKLGARLVGFEARSLKLASRIDDRLDTLRCVMISRSSLKPINPRSNIQCPVPDSARPLRTLSEPPCSTEQICAACASSRPPPFTSFQLVTAQRPSLAFMTARRMRARDFLRIAGVDQLLQGGTQILMPQSRSELSD